MLKKLPLDIVCCCTLTVLIVCFFSKIIFIPDGNFMGGVDISGYSFWTQGFTKEMLLSGTLPLWNPYIYCGHPFLATPPNFVFYPSTLLYVLMPLPSAFNADILLHVIVAATGMFFFVKMITQNRYAGLASAIVYSLSGTYMWRINLGHLPFIHSAALIPWIFYYIEQTLRSNRIFYLYISGLILGIQILGGDPQISYYTSLFLTLYFFIRWFYISKSIIVDSILKAIRYYIIIPFVAFGISAIQLLPTFEFASLSQRTMNTYDFVTFMSFDPLHFFQYIVPYFVSQSINLTPEFGCYLGILSIILAIIGGSFSRHRKYTIPLVIMLFIALTFMLGRYTPLYYIYYKFLPVLSSFRIPARCLIIFGFILSILVGFGVQHLYEFGLKGYQRYLAIAGLFIILIFIFIGISAYQNYGVIIQNIPLSSTSIKFSILFTFIGFILFSTLNFIHNKHIIAGLCIGILFIDLYLVCSPLIPELNEKDLAQKKGFEIAFQSNDNFFRVNIPGFGPAEIDNPIWGLPNHAIKYHYYNANGYSPLILKDYCNFVYAMADVPVPVQNLHTFIPPLSQPEKVFSSRILGTKYALALTPTGLKMLTAREIQPHATLIREVLFKSKIDDQISILKQSNFDTRKIVLLNESDKNYILSNNVAAGSSDLDKVVVTNYTPNRLDLKSDSPSTTILLLSELYYPSWKAYVDGKDVPILRADYILRALKLDAGKHSITIVYKPMSLYIGAFISALTILFIILLYLYLKRKNSPKEEVQLL